MYHDFMSSFKNMAPWISNGEINQIQVGLGPAGEVIYPNYQLQWLTLQEYQQLMHLMI